MFERGILKSLYLLPLHLTVTSLAQNLKVTRPTISQIVNGRAGISSEMALRFSKAFGTTPEYWLNMQQSYDLWQAKQKFKATHIKVLVGLELAGLAVTIPLYAIRFSPKKCQTFLNKSLFNKFTLITNPNYQNHPQEGVVRKSSAKSRSPKTTSHYKTQIDPPN